MWSEGRIFHEGKIVRAGTALLLFFNLFLAGCLDTRVAAGSGESCSESAPDYLTDGEVIAYGRKAMQERLQAILRGEVKLPQPLPGSAEFEIKERLNKAMVLLSFTYRVGDQTVTNYGSGVIVDKSADGWDILTNAHVVNNDGDVPDGAWLDSLRVGRTVNEVRNGGGDEFGGNFVRAVKLAGEDAAVVRIYNIRGMYADRLSGFEPVSLDTGVSLGGEQLLWYVAAPYDYAAAMIDANLGLGRYFEAMQINGCKFPVADVFQGGRPGEDGMSGTPVVNGNGAVVGLMTRLGVFEVGGEAQVEVGILDLNKGVEQLGGVLGEVQINEQGYMVLPLPEFEAK